MLPLPKSSAPCLQSLELPCQQLAPYRSYNSKVDILPQIYTGNSLIYERFVCEYSYRLHVTVMNVPG